MSFSEERARDKRKGWLPQRERPVSSKAPNRDKRFLLEFYLSEAEAFHMRPLLGWDASFGWFKQGRYRTHAAAVRVAEQVMRKVRQGPLSYYYTRATANSIWRVNGEVITV